MLPQMIAGVAAPAGARTRRRSCCDRVGLAPRAGHRPARLSGGEQQRVAIVRALANAPQVLLADEPTGNLDHATGEGVLDTLLDLVRQTGLAALIATHNLDLAAASTASSRSQTGGSEPPREPGEAPTLRSGTDGFGPGHDDKRCNGLKRRRTFDHG